MGFLADLKVMRQEKSYRLLMELLAILFAFGIGFMVGMVYDRDQVAKELRAQGIHADVGF